MQTTKKAIGFCLLIVCTFSFIWIQSAFAGNRNNNDALVLDSEEGDPAVLSSLSVELFLSNNGSSTFVEYQGDEAQEQTSPLAWYQHFDDTGYEHLNTSIAEHRSFMRGKSLNPNLFAETEDRLLYLGQPSDVYWQHFNDAQFDLSILDKETKEEATYTFHATDEDIPSVASFDIQRVIPQLPYVHVLVEAFYSDPRGYDGEIDLFLFTIDLDDIEEEQPTELTFERSFARDMDSPYSIQVASDPVESYPYLALRTIEMDDPDAAELTPGDYYLYNMESQEWIDMNLHEELAYAHVFIQEDTIYVLDHVDNQFDVYEYSMDTGELTPLSTFEVDRPEIGGNASNHYSDFEFTENILVKDGNVLLYESGYGFEEELPTTLPMQVNELETGETLFKGQLRPQEDTTNEDIHIELLNIDW